MSAKRAPPPPAHSRSHGSAPRAGRAHSPTHPQSLSASGSTRPKTKSKARAQGGISAFAARTQRALVTAPKLPAPAETTPVVPTPPTSVAGPTTSPAPAPPHLTPPSSPVVARASSARPRLSSSKPTVPSHPAEPRRPRSHSRGAVSSSSESATSSSGSDSADEESPVDPILAKQVELVALYFLTAQVLVPFALLFDQIYATLAPGDGKEANMTKDDVPRSDITPKELQEFCATFGGRAVGDPAPS